MTKPRRKKASRQYPRQGFLRLPVSGSDTEYALIPHSLFDANISAAAFKMAMELYYFRKAVSGHYPGAELIALSMEELPGLIRSGEAELISAGILLLHEDGTFDMKDTPEEDCEL